RRAPSRQSASVQLGMVGGRSRRRTLIGAGFKANVSVWGDLVGFDPVSEPPPVTYPGTGGASRRSPNDCWRRPITSDLLINLQEWMFRRRFFCTILPSPETPCSLDTPG